MAQQAARRSYNSEVVGSNLTRGNMLKFFEMKNGVFSDFGLTCAEYK